jgi:hypothetical protein
MELPAWACRVGQETVGGRRKHVVLPFVERSSRCIVIGFASALLDSYSACLASSLSEQDCAQLDVESCLGIAAFVDLALGKVEACPPHGLGSASSYIVS